MERSELWQKLYLSGMDEGAPALARQNGLGLELTDFCVAANLEDPDRRSAAAGRQEGIGRFWLHAPFAELFPCAIDPLAREVARRRYAQTVETAKALGIRRVVLHGGFVPLVYFPEWYVEQSVLFWRSFLPLVPPEMTLALENVMEPDPTLLAAIAAGVDDPRLRLCLDVGHANSCVGKVPPLEWIGPMAPWLCHVHLHNNEGGWDLHAPLGEGSVPMEPLLDKLLTLCPDATYTIENQTCAASLAWLRDKGFGGRDT